MKLRIAESALVESQNLARNSGTRDVLDAAKCIGSTRRGCLTTPPPPSPPASSAVRLPKLPARNPTSSGQPGAVESRGRKDSTETTSSKS